jgi:Radical SAM superfamily
MMIQIEITTRCNFDCFYCAGRLMQQGDMSFEVFTSLLESHIARYGAADVVSLQGEGEPTLHPDFFRMTERVLAIGAQPYTITNGSYKHPERFVGLFSQIGVSIDSLDDRIASAMGRYNLPRTIAFIEALAPSTKIFIHSVAHREYTPPIGAWCRQRGYTHIVQPLQTKADYAHRYKNRIAATAAAGPFSCGYLTTPSMRYYNLDGVEMPCCYIKDAGQFKGIEALLKHQQSGTWAECCTGCRFGCAMRDTVTT